jgi:caa(3)-type oxidase subunit IV
MTQQHANVSSERKPSSGMRVFIALAALTVIEFVVAVTVDANVPILAAFAVAKAALIMYYFMHIARLWKPLEEED